MREPIFIQSQMDEDTLADTFNLAWHIRYLNGDIMQSEWTPVLVPSISKTLAARDDEDRLIIFGQHRSAEYKIELAKVDWGLVSKFNFRVLQLASEPTSKVVGIWVYLTNGSIIKVSVSGHVELSEGLK